MYTCMCVYHPSNAHATFYLGQRFSDIIIVPDNIMYVDQEWILDVAHAHNTIKFLVKSIDTALYTQPFSLVISLTLIIIIIIICSEPANINITTVCH